MISELGIDEGLLSFQIAYVRRTTNQEAKFVFSVFLTLPCHATPARHHLLSSLHLRISMSVPNDELRWFFFFFFFFFFEYLV